VRIAAEPENSAKANYVQPFVLDTAKVRRELGYTEMHSAEDQLLEMLDMGNSREGQDKPVSRVQERSPK
jgi:hypothetical protein